MTQQALVVTATGSEKPGIVECVTQVLGEHRVNVKASHTARLGGGICDVDVGFCARS